MNWRLVRALLVAALVAGVIVKMPAITNASYSGGPGAGTLSIKPVGHVSAGTAEISAYDPQTKRLFITGPTTKIYDISDPASATLVANLAFDSTSVAIKNGVVALAVPASPTVDPGNVLLMDANGSVNATIQVGALPDMVTFTNDGSKVLVANEGERGTIIDPNGTVSIIDVAGKSVATVEFTAYNTRRNELLGKGVRIFPDSASVAQDFEPEYITVAPDDATAWVTLQESNAVATIDIATASVKNILPLGMKDWSRGLPTLSTYDVAALPEVGRTEVTTAYPGGQSIKLGGFSGLQYEGTVAGKMRFITHTDRGPNGDPVDIVPGIAGLERPFVLPDFQPEIVRLELDPATGGLTVLNRIGLKHADDTTMTGLPNTQAGAQGTAYTDEVAVDLFGNVVANDPMGGDFEGIAIAGDGSFWMCDEYRPAIYHFDADGTMLDRYVPEGTAAAAGVPEGSLGTEALPATYASRRANRGFEGITMSGDDIYAIIQSPIDNPDSATDANSKASRNLRILKFDSDAETTTAEYVYQLDDITGSGTAKTDKLSDLAYVAEGRLLAVERDDRTTSASNKLLYEVDLAGATDIHMAANLSALPAGKTVEQCTSEELAAAGVKVVHKRRVANLATLGYTGVSKVEGVAIVDTDTVAVINDNDFGVTTTPITGDGTMVMNPTPEPARLGLVNFTVPNGMDPSDRDGPASGKLLQNVNVPVYGMYLPDGIANLNTGGANYFITANEGDDRSIDKNRISTVSLDSTRFPTGAALKNNAVLGRLNISVLGAIDGDPDGDGDYDWLQTYGSRSFTIWDAAGNQVFDSGDDLERITASLTPTLFNANGEGLTTDAALAAKWDERSSAKGPEPESVLVAPLGARKLAFVCLERAGGGIMAYDVTNPKAPTFETYARSANDLGPEGLTWIPANQSPTGAALIVVTNEYTGTVNFYAVSDDTVAPTTTAPGLPIGWSHKDVTVTLSATDSALPTQTVSGVASTRFALTPGTSGTYAAPFAISAEGTTTLAYSSTDRAGNSEATSTATVRIDKTKPTISTNAVASYTGSGTITITAADTLSGLDTLSWSLDGVDITVPGRASQSVKVTRAGAHALECWTTDIAGNESTHTIANFVVTHSTECTVTGETTVVIGYGDDFQIVGTLRDGARGVPGESVTLESSENGVDWDETLEAGTTSASGAFSIWVKPAVKTSYRVKFTGATGYSASSSAVTVVTPRAYLSAPSSPSKVKRNKSFTSTGLLKPRHDSGTKAVAIKCYRSQGGSWVYKKTVWAKVSNSGSSSKYSASVKLTQTGRWRLVANHSDADHAVSASSSRYLTVR